MQIVSEVPGEITGEGGDVEDQDESGIYEYFLRLSGDDKEVDWRELKEILDHCLKRDLLSGNHNNSNRSNQNVSKSYVDGVNSVASAGDSQQTQNDENSFLTNLLSLICGTFCKDSPLAELVPKPTQSSNLMASFADYHLQGFSKDICRSMVAMLDTDRSGKLGFEEFKVLWHMLQKWTNVWAVHDVDHSGSFSGFELREALNLAGYRLNNKVLNVIMHRYGNRNGEIAFDDFLMCAIKLRTMLDIFYNKDESETNIASFSKEEWLEATLSS